MNAREQSPERDPYKHGSTIFDRHKGNSVERIMFSTNDTETTEYPHAKKKKIHSNLDPCTKISLQLIIHLNLKLKTIKLLGENKRKSL